LPIELHHFFWDCSPADIDVERNADQVLTRLLDHGDLAAARWAWETYGAARIREFLLRRGWRTLSRKTIAFWRALLSMEDQECLKPSSLRHNRPFWNV